MEIVHGTEKDVLYTRNGASLFQRRIMRGSSSFSPSHRQPIAANLHARTNQPTINITTTDPDSERYDRRHRHPA